MDKQAENFLSNMALDTTETKNLAETYPETVKRLTSLHEQWLKQLPKK